MEKSLRTQLQNCSKIVWRTETNYVAKHVHLSVCVDLEEDRSKNINDLHLDAWLGDMCPGPLGSDENIVRMCTY